MTEEKQKLIEIDGTTSITDDSKFYISKNNIDFSIDWSDVRAAVGLTSLSITTIESDITITDSFQYNTIIANPNTSSQYGLLTISAPATGANNIGKPYRVEHGANQGLCRVDANGLQKFLWKGKDLQYIVLYHPGDYVEFYWNSNLSKWSIKDYNIAMRLNWDNNSDWTNREFGNGVTYDNKSAAIDLTGMVVTEATSNYTAIIVYDAGGVGASGILYVYDYSSGFTFWTNNRQLTTSDGTTCDVNEVSGTSKNIDYNLYHGFDVNIIDISSELFVSTDATWNNAFRSTNGVAVGTGGQALGRNAYQVDTNSLKMQVGGDGIEYILDSLGSLGNLAAQDWYKNLRYNF